FLLLCMGCAFFLSRPLPSALYPPSLHDALPISANLGLAICTSTAIQLARWWVSNPLGAWACLGQAQKQAAHIIYYALLANTHVLLTLRRLAVTPVCLLSQTKLRCQQQHNRNGIMIANNSVVGWSF